MVMEVMTVEAGMVEDLHSCQEVLLLDCISRDFLECLLEALVYISLTDVEKVL